MAPDPDRCPCGCDERDHYSPVRIDPQRGAWVLRGMVLFGIALALLYVGQGL